MVMNLSLSARSLYIRSTRIFALNFNAMEWHNHLWWEEAMKATKHNIFDFPAGCAA